MTATTCPTCSGRLSIKQRISGTGRVKRPPDNKRKSRNCASGRLSVLAHFAAARVDLRRLRAENIVDFAEDNSVYLIRDKDAGAFYNSVAREITNDICSYS